MSITVEVLFMKGGDPEFTFTAFGQNAKNVKVTVPQEITWRIAPGSTPGTYFRETDGVVFLPSGGAPDLWPYSQPSYDQALGQYRVFDPVPSTGPTRMYSYRVTVVNDGVFTHDPDVTNEPPG